MAKTLLPPSSKSSRAVNRSLSKTLARYPEVKKAKRRRAAKVSLAGMLLAGALVAGVIFGVSMAKDAHGR